MNTYDAVIVGGSYAGLSAAMQLARARRRVCVVDTGAPRNRFAPAAHGFFGQDGEPPLAMIARGRERLLAYPSMTLVHGKATAARALGCDNRTDDAPGARHSQSHSDDKAKSAERAGHVGHAKSTSRFEVQLEDGTRLHAAKLVLAYGVHDLLPDMAGLSERWGQSVLHCPYCHGYEFQGQRLGVLYHAPSSLQHAQLIAEWGPTPLFLHGNDSVASHELARLQALGIAIEPARIAALQGRAAGLEAVQLEDAGAATAARCR